MGNPNIRGRVLVADDYFINQELLKEMLGSFDCEIDTAENGREALERYSSNEYDLIFMDIQMPEMDGYETTRQIRIKEEDVPKHTPIVAVTASALVDDKQKCFDAGVDHYISKPFQLNDILETVNRFLPLD